LTHEGSIESFVELLETTFGMDLFSNSKGIGGATSFTSELNLHLNHVHRLNAQSSCAGRQSTAEEVEIEILAHV